VETEVRMMTNGGEECDPLTPDEIAEEVWEDESPATVEPPKIPLDKRHPDVNELLKQTKSFEE
jgi:hypothetical protein